VVGLISEVALFGAYLSVSLYRLKEPQQEMAGQVHQ
jgi:hypothetical protein